MEKALTKFKEEYRTQPPAKKMNCNLIKSNNKRNRKHTVIPKYDPNTITDDKIKQVLLV